ncbi:hypothetical protein ACFX2G_002905 [Malus domestica]
MSRVMNQVNDAHLEKVLAVCNGLFEDMVDQLNDLLTSMDVNQSEKLLSVAKINNKKTESSSTALHHLSLSLSKSLPHIPFKPLSTQSNGLICTRQDLTIRCLAYLNIKGIDKPSALRQSNRYGKGQKKVSLRNDHSWKEYRL